MTTDLPIACSLSATEMPLRLAEMAALGRDGLVEYETSHATAVLRFRDELGVRHRLESIVVAESECCAFLTMRLRDDGSAITLTIEGPDGAEVAIDELVRAFAGEELGLHRRRRGNGC